MKKVELKTKKNAGKITDFLQSITDKQQLADSKELIEIMKEITGKKPVMWGSSIVGFDTYTYKRSTGAEGEWMMVGFSPRKHGFSVYVLSGFDDMQDLVLKLDLKKVPEKGCCLVFKNLESIHLPTIKKIITKGYKEMKRKYSK